MTRLKLELANVFARVFLLEFNSFKANVPFLEPLKDYVITYRTRSTIWEGFRIQKVKKSGMIRYTVVIR